MANTLFLSKLSENRSLKVRVYHQFNVFTDQRLSSPNKAD